MGELDLINGFALIDEVKHTVANGEGEDSFYYFSVIVPKVLKADVEKDYLAAVAHLPKGFHATDAYKAKSLDTALMDALTAIFLKYHLHVIVFRYDKRKLYRATTEFLTALDHPEITDRAHNWEVQAFFHFVQHLDRFLEKQVNWPLPLCAFCDRGIYGIKDPIEAVDIDSPYLQRAVFSSRKKVRLLGLADHVGYIFAKARLATHQASGKNSIAVLQENVFGQQLVKISQAKHFHYLEA